MRCEGWGWGERLFPPIASRSWKLGLKPLGCSRRAGCWDDALRSWDLCLAGWGMCLKRALNPVQSRTPHFKTKHYAELSNSMIILREDALEMGLPSNITQPATPLPVIPPHPELPTLMHLLERAHLGLNAVTEGLGVPDPGFMLGSVGFMALAPSIGVPQEYG